MYNFDTRKIIFKRISCEYVDVSRRKIIFLNTCNIPTKALLL